MSSGRSLLLLLFWGDFAVCSPVIMQSNNCECGGGEDGWAAGCLSQRGLWISKAPAPSEWPPAGASGMRPGCPREPPPIPQGCAPPRDPRSLPWRREWWSSVLGGAPDGRVEGNCGLFSKIYMKCGLPVDRFYYNVTSKNCKPYVDYGCRFRRNRFNTMEQCEEYCAPKTDLRIQYGARGQARGAVQVFAAPWPESRALQAGSADSEAPLQEGTEGQGLRQTGRRAGLRGGNLGLLLRAEERGMHQDEARRREPPGAFGRKEILE
ncbi:chelonianin-like [Crotalus adamanteus]|uniref:Chelonianin-like n=1 Tax=Crotalus adamanteus TaxID=8729 RepID=A0AAW1BUL4_CROAD